MTNNTKTHSPFYYDVRKVVRKAVASAPWIAGTGAFMALFLIVDGYGRDWQ